MKIAILGAGNVGGALGESWTRHGHEVYFGVRQPEAAKVQSVLKKCGPRARAETPADAVHSSEVVVNALSWPATKAVLESLNLQGKTLLDCTNPLLPDLSGLEVGTTTSGGELVAQWAKGALVVKIFNSTGFANMLNPVYEGKAAQMFYCGDDASAKSTAAALAKIIGFDPIDVGPLSSSRMLEPHALLWVWLALKGGMGREFAFQLVKR
jgi:predicted dinucleotide-binding enzyme